MPHRQDEAAAGCFCLCIFVISIVLFACSFDTLEPRNYGLVYDDTYKTVIRDDIRRKSRADTGRYLIGLGRSILSFPKGLVVMEWMKNGVDSESMECWTSNGQNVYLDISLQLKVRKERLPDLYYRYGLQWRDRIRLSIQRLIKDTTPDFHTLKFFTHRVLISSTLQSTLNAAFNSAGGFVTIIDFQLRRIGLPEEFEGAILNKILRLQEQQKALNMQLVDLAFTEKERQTALAEADSGLVFEEATQGGNILIAQKRVDGDSDFIKLYAKMYRKFGDTLGWLADSRFGYTALHYFIYSRLGKDHQASSLRELLGYGTGYSDKLLNRMPPPPGTLTR